MPQIAAIRKIKVPYGLEDYLPSGVSTYTGMPAHAECKYFLHGMIIEADTTVEGPSPSFCRHLKAAVMDQDQKSSIEKESGILGYKQPAMVVTARARFCNGRAKQALKKCSLQQH